MTLLIYKMAFLYVMANIHYPLSIATKGDLGPSDHPACGGVACPVNNDQLQPKKDTTTTTSSSDSIQGGPNVLCRGKIIHHSCEPCAVGFKDTGTDCVPLNQKPIPQHHSKAYQQGYQVGCTEDQTRRIS